MPLGFTVNMPGFAHTWVGLRAKRWLRKVMGLLGGRDNIVFLIRTNQNILDKFPPDAVAYYRQQLRFPQGYVDAFTDDEVYEWLPEEYRAIIEAEPHGKTWAYNQLKHIRSMFIPSS
jgi:hypothetical protein